MGAPGGPRPPPLTQSQTGRMLYMWNDGWTALDLGKHFGVGHATISKILADLRADGKQVRVGKRKTETAH